jgi:hypothetical protein
VAALVSDWHVYTVEWEPGEIRFLRRRCADLQLPTTGGAAASRGRRGRRARKAADLNPWPAPFDQPFYLVMNVAVGGNFPGAPNADTRFPAELVVDYVRVYDKAVATAPSNPSAEGVFPWQKKGGTKGEPAMSRPTPR